MKIFIDGMSCEHCTLSVKKALAGLKVLSNIDVNLQEGYATFDGLIDDKILQDAIEDIGFDVVKIEK